MPAQMDKKKALIATSRKLDNLHYKSFRDGMELQEHGSLA
jgi:hypothetical protein